MSVGALSPNAGWGLHRYSRGKDDELLRLWLLGLSMWLRAEVMVPPQDDAPRISELKRARGDINSWLALPGKFTKCAVKGEGEWERRADRGAHTSNHREEELHLPGSILHQYLFNWSTNLIHVDLCRRCSRVPRTPGPQIAPRQTHSTSCVQMHALLPGPAASPAWKI